MVLSPTKHGMVFAACRNGAVANKRLIEESRAIGLHDTLERSVPNEMRLLHQIVPVGSANLSRAKTGILLQVHTHPRMAAPTSADNRGRWRWHKSAILAPRESSAATVVV
jgi:hypothetical protein